jgi:AcrR family transcriptional regulator
MVIRQRAILAEDKQERHRAILDAAARLLGRSPDRIASMADVADEAGVAKGTVYLYFASKEELLLAVHERNIDGFFRALIARLEADEPVRIQDVLALTHEHIVEPPLFLPLAARCFGLMAQSIPAGPALAFKQRMAERLTRAGTGLERHFGQLTPGAGLALLRHSYALILGLWQMSGQSFCAAGPAEAAPPALAYAYPEELDRALIALWNGTIATARDHSARG